MAKDARGHGSERRGGTTVKVSVDPSKLGFRMADIGPGGSEHNVKTGGTWSADHEAAHMLSAGSPKSEPVPVHPAQSMMDIGKAFAAKYGGPKDHARTQRAFNSGKREIARLRQQGK